MKKMKKSSKGFTLTELAIVIAVIAILIAVLVPTFVSLINKANESNDKQLVKNLNTSLSTYEIINGETDGVIEAIAALKEEGYDVTKLTPTSDGSVIVYNTTTHAFVLYSDDFSSISYGEVSDGDNLVVIGCTTATATSAYNALRVTEYCVYSEKGATIDCTASNATIYVYTESGTTTINAPEADVYHYGEAETVEITAVAKSSYHLYAQVETVKIASGHVVVEEDASITKLVVNTTTANAVITTLNSDTATISRVVTADSSFTVEDSTGAEVTTISTVTVASVDEIEEMEAVTYITSVPSTITSGTYVLSSNITGNFVIPEGAIVTIDLNGWTIKGAAGTATVQNGGATVTSNCAFLNYGTLTITGDGYVSCYGSDVDAAVFNAYGAITYIDGGTYTQGNWYLLHNYGYMQIENANIIGNSKSSSVVHNGYYSYDADGEGRKEEAVMIINGLSFSNDTKAELGTSSLIKNDDMGNLTINDGSFKNAPAYVLLNYHICTINGGEFSGISCIGAYGSGNDINAGVLVINGGTFTNVGAGHSVLFAYGNAVNGSVVTVNGGTFISAGALINVGQYASVNVAYGTFTQTVQGYYSLYFSGNNSTISFNSGTVNYLKYLIGYGSTVDKETVTLTYGGAVLNDIGE